jgi:DUF1680 family protein
MRAALQSTIALIALLTAVSQINSVARAETVSIVIASIRLIPYFVWANRGTSEMSLWLPLNRSDE